MSRKRVNFDDEKDGDIPRIMNIFFERYQLLQFLLRIHLMLGFQRKRFMEIFVGLAILLPLSALAIQAREADSDDDHCDFL